MIEQTFFSSCVCVILFICVQVLTADSADLNATRRGTEDFSGTRSSEYFLFIFFKAEGTCFVIITSGVCNVTAERQSSANTLDYQLVSC